MFLRQEGSFKNDPDYNIYVGYSFGIRQGTASHQLGCGALALIATKDKVDMVDKPAHRTNMCGPFHLFHLFHPDIRQGTVSHPLGYGALALIVTKDKVNRVDRPCLSMTSPHPGYDGPDSQLDRVPRPSSKSELQEPPPKEQPARAPPGSTEPPGYIRPPSSTGPPSSTSA